MLVHIRQGDTAILETPWNTFIPLREPRALAFTEIQDIDRLDDNPVLDVADYYGFAKKLVDSWGSGSLSFLVFSDGYRWGFARLYQNARRLKLNRRKIKALKVAERSYDRAKFSIFENLEHTHCILGENDENLSNLIQGILTADLIIVGDQQRMIPKFLANYYDHERPAVLIVLYKGAQPPDYAAELSLTRRKAIVIPFRIGDGSYMPHVITSVRTILSCKKR